MTISRKNHGEAVQRDPRWAALLCRDPRADGSFVYAVRSTGIYCRPSCPARLARPHNVIFHASAAEAEAAGYRACRRCRPAQDSAAARQAAIVTRLCRYIESSEHIPSLAELAAFAGCSRSHLQRTFKNVAGVTPRAYAGQWRTGRMRQELNRSASVTEAMYAAGYNSSGRFYSQSGQPLGMSPSRYRSGGAGSCIRFAAGQCSLGAIVVAQSEIGVCAILLGDDADALVRQLQDQFPRAELVAGDPAFEQLVAAVVGFIEAPRTGLELPLDIRGTAFQCRVWEVLRQIPPGQTLSYTEVAQRLAAPQAVRAVAGACAANLLAVAIPCHRVVRRDGGLSGYRWGVERKRALLQREAEP